MTCNSATGAWRINLSSLSNNRQPITRFVLKSSKLAAVKKHCWQRVKCVFANPWMGSLIGVASALLSWSATAPGRGRWRN
jgi:hypothetical protein